MHTPYSWPLRCGHFKSMDFPIDSPRQIADDVFVRGDTVNLPAVARETIRAVVGVGSPTHAHLFMAAPVRPFQKFELPY